MIDVRYETFLALCKIRNYTRTAESLHITQPAVTQHIQYLENEYGCKLFRYQGKTLMLTEKGELLYHFTLTMRSDSEKLKELLQTDLPRKIHFGATLTIGEYVLPPILSTLMKDHEITMIVSNTKILLQKLRDGEIDFAFLEGYFDKSEYDYRLFSLEPYIGVCSPESPLAGRSVPMTELLSQTLILREQGSGTRDIFEGILAENNLAVGGFARVHEIGNMSAIKQLVEQGLGITFLYETAAQEELAMGKLARLSIENFHNRREFNFVFLKGSLHQKTYLAFLERFTGAQEKNR